VRHIPKKYWFFLCFFALHIANSIGQCAFEGDILIEDLATTSIPINISGAVNNNLSTNNGLKAVTVHFKHQFVGDIIIELVSPDGQKVQLVGPSQTISPSTSLVTCWNVQFFAESLVAVPDAGYDDVWNSLQTWPGFKTYVGKYYPHMGKLEDFNTGTVDGVWTLNVIDNVQFGEGHIYCLNLTFCDEEGINQETCSLVEHTLEEESFQACEGDSSLVLQLEPEFDQNFDPTVYGYSYTIFKEDEFQSLDNDLDLTMNEPGTYTICGIHYFLSDLSSLDNIPIGNSKTEMIIYIQENSLCASTTENCVTVLIHPFPEEVTDIVSICSGDTLFVNGTPYFETGTYEILTSVNPCDSTSFLELTVNEVEIQLGSDLDSLSCNNLSTHLDASASNFPDDASIEWSTMGGNFTTNKDSLIVEIDKPGIYTFEVVLDGCMFTEDISIGETDDYVNVSMSASTLTCTLDSTFIDLTASDTIDSISWSGPFEFSTLNEDIRVGSGGIYSVNFTTNFGCNIMREIEVLEERVYPNLVIIGDTLSCTKFEVTLSTSPNDTLGSTFKWFSDNGLLGTNTFQNVVDPGLYSVEITTELGCIDTLSFDVITQFREIDVELLSDTIDCENSFVNVAFTSSIKNLNVLWQLPNEDLIIDSSFNTSQVGEYQLSLSDSLGCTLDTFLFVNSDSLLPEVSILGTSFFCGDDSIKLSAQVNFDNLLYEWKKQDGSIDTNEEIFIFSPGRYILKVCRPNGCCAIDTIDVGVDITVPSISFDFQNINCTNDTVYIIPSDTDSFLLEWSLEGINFPVDSNIIQVTEPGFYEVLVTNETNGCNSLYSFDITSDKYDKIESLNADILNCAMTQVQILITASRAFDSFTWSGPSVLDTNLEPFVNAPGEYIIDYTFTNGCSGQDTIEIIQEGELPNLQGEDVTITCFENQVTLSVEYSSSSIALNWTGPNGFNMTGESVLASDPGIYTVIGIAAGSCKDTIEIELIGDLQPPTVTIVEDGEITCANALVGLSATIDANTEFYEISGPGVVNADDLNFDVSISGLYTIEATGFNGCVSVASTTVNQSTDFPSYIVNLDSLSCDISSVEVGFDSPDQELDVSWEAPVEIDDGEYTFTTNQTGNYIFTLMNANGCVVVDSFFIFMDTFPPEGEILLSSKINCVEDFVELSILDFESDWQVTWSGPGVGDPGVPQFTTDQVGEYSLSLIARNGCITEDNIVIEYDTLMPDIAIVGDPINCAAGKTFLRVDSDLIIANYEWAGPNNFVSNDAEPLIFEEGMYFVMVTALNGCESFDTIIVEDERMFPEIIIEDFYLPCSGAPEEVFTSFITEGAFIRWFGPNNYFSELDTALVIKAGEYIGIAFNVEGCTTSDTFQVIDEPVLPEFGGFSELLLCLGPVPITATDVEDDLSVVWNGPNNFYSEDNPALADEPGIYQLIVTTLKGCTDTMSIEVIDGRIFPKAEASLNGLFQCENLEVNLSGEGSSTGNIYTYNWTTEDGNIIGGQNTLNPSIDLEGTYVIEVINSIIGCASYDTLFLTIQEQDLKGAEIEVLKPTCLNFGNGQINITDIIGGFEPYNFYVDGSDYGQRTNIEYLQSGDHLVTIKDSLGCVFDTLVFISEDGLLTVELPSDTTLCFGDSILIQPTINFNLDSIQSIVWSSNVPCNGCTEFQLFLNQNITITVEVTDINGCVAEDELNLIVNRPNNLPFPQIFSPNGDNINDVFYMPMTKGLIVINYLKIYDNWGGLLYTQSEHLPGDESIGWDGTVNGQNVEIGMYIVEALVTLVDGSEVIYVGGLTLIR
jgi:gliding motility-associated-like protein